jgi:methylglutaconyl-CoA hydratase
MPHVRVEIEGPIGRIVMSRPKRHNAFDETMIARLAEAIARLRDEKAVRVVLLAGEGPSFSAGGDLEWMQRSAAASREVNLIDARRFAEMLRAFYELPKPTIALVHGPAYGGGVGLTAAADFAIATPDAVFSLSEVKLGLIPAVISPYVIDAIGPRATRALALSAERLGAEEALRLGLVTRVVPAEELEGAAQSLARVLLANSPDALARTKQLITTVSAMPIGDKTMEETARRIADARASEEGREGVAAFIGKRRPGWVAR